jgi:hypothetical protein
LDGNSEEILAYPPSHVYESAPNKETDVNFEFNISLKALTAVGNGISVPNSSHLFETKTKTKKTTV